MTGGWLVLIALVAGVPDETLLDEDFEAASSLEAWEEFLGAGGPGGSSSYALAEGALRLAGEKGTGRWLALVRKVDPGKARWVRIAARMKTRGADPVGARYRNCNVFFRFDGGPVQACRQLFGDQPWTPVARRVPVPEGTGELTIGCFLSVPGEAWFDDIRVEAVDAPAWQVRREDALEYRVLPNDRVGEDAIRYNGESLRLMREFFGVRGPDVIPFHKYPDLDTKEEYTGVRGNAHRWGAEIHSIWPSDRHEIVHVFADGWGDPPALLGEGLAVLLSGGWQGEDIPAAGGKVIREGAWIPLERILDTGAFRSHPDLRTYAIAGAFTGWVLETKGKEVLRDLYRKMENRASPKKNAEVVRDLLGMDLEEADALLRESLRPQASRDRRPSRRRILRGLVGAPDRGRPPTGR